MIILILTSVTIVCGWMTIIKRVVRNEIRFEDTQIEEMREFRERGRK